MPPLGLLEVEGVGHVHDQHPQHNQEESQPWQEEVPSPSPDTVASKAEQEIIFLSDCLTKTNLFTKADTDAKTPKSPPNMIILSLCSSWLVRAMVMRAMPEMR